MVNDMDGIAGMSALSRDLREKFFLEAPQEVTLVISSDPLNKAYLSGYVSMTHDLAPAYRSAVLASRDNVSLVVSAADAGPARNFFADASHLYRYGEFYFETTDDAFSEFRKDTHAGFQEAFAHAIRAHRSADGLVGVDRSNDDVAWALCREILGENRVRDITPDLARTRATKIEGEVVRLRRASQLVEEGFRQVAEIARPGLTERDLAAVVTRSMVAGGGVPRFVSVTSGIRSALADAYPTDRKMLAGDILRIDAGCTVDGYWSDIGRTFVFGEPDARQSRIYEALHVGLEAELAAVRAGIQADALFAIAMESVRSSGIPHYRRQHCGHGIGLKSYDNPTIRTGDTTLLREGMCLCLETPYYEIGVDGMMVEDMIRVTTTGYEPLTTISRELVVIS
ncbi:metallopeptidase M24 family protein (plasmid) [Ochrobactrum quorumnocens]|uniref:Metallopeptidase M24 family protein n=2 Tax=Ochrobactrum quorumnocens TaxID=271865 RepID=A0A248UMS4_9HYPH|nr:metallopeptidase M24 family protein [[Ochrobactrum] quorumnocens]